MSAPNAKLRSERFFGRSNPTPVPVDTRNRQGPMRRMHTDNDLIKRGMVSSVDSFASTPQPLSSSPSELTVRRRDKTHTERAMTICDATSSRDVLAQSASRISQDSKTKELREKVQQLINSNKPTAEQLNRLGKTFQLLLSDKIGLDLFREFLATEYCHETIDFWCECEDYRGLNDLDESALKERAKRLYDEFIAENSSRQVNLDSETRKLTAETIDAPGIDTKAFELPQKKIQCLMEKDKYQRFLQSDVYKFALEFTQKSSDSATSLRDA